MSQKKIKAGGKIKIRTMCFMALAQQMWILDPFLQNTFIIFSLGQEWHLAIKINFWLCNSHSASKHCHLSVDAFYFCISTNRIFLMLTKYFSLKKWQLKQKLCITVHLYRYLPTLYPGATSSRKLENLESFNRATDNILHIYDHLYRWYRTA